MTRRTRRLRTRLLVAMIAIALGTLVVTAAVTAGLARHTATDAARDTLADDTPVVADELNQLIALLPAVRTADITPAGRRQIRRIRTLVQTTLKVSDGAVVAIDDTIYVAGGGPVMGGGFQSAINEAFVLG